MKSKGGYIIIGRRIMEFKDAVVIPPKDKLDYLAESVIEETIGVQQ